MLRRSKLQKSSHAIFQGYQSFSVARWFCGGAGWLYQFGGHRLSACAGLQGDTGRNFVMDVGARHRHGYLLGVTGLLMAFPKEVVVAIAGLALLCRTGIARHDWQWPGRGTERRFAPRSRADHFPCHTVGRGDSWHWCGLLRRGFGRYRAVCTTIRAIPLRRALEFLVCAACQPGTALTATAPSPAKKHEHSFCR